MQLLSHSGWEKMPKAHQIEIVHNAQCMSIPNLYFRDLFRKNLHMVCRLFIPLVAYQICTLLKVKGLKIRQRLILDLWLLWMSQIFLSIFCKTILILLQKFSSLHIRTCDPMVSTLNSRHIDWDSIPCTNQFSLIIPLNTIFKISCFWLNRQIFWHQLFQSLTFWHLQTLLRASVFQLNDNSLGWTLSLEP